MKNISIGNWITIALVLANGIFIGASLSKDVENVKVEVIKVGRVANTAKEMAYENKQEVAVVKATIEQGFSNLEKLIIKNGN